MRRGRAARRSLTPSSPPNHGCDVACRTSACRSLAFADDPVERLVDLGLERRLVVEAREVASRNSATLLSLVARAGRCGTSPYDRRCRPACSRGRRVAAPPRRGRRPTAALTRDDDAIAPRATAQRRAGPGGRVDRGAPAAAGAGSAGGDSAAAPSPAPWRPGRGASGAGLAVVGLGRRLGRRADRSSVVPTVPRSGHRRPTGRPWRPRRPPPGELLHHLLHLGELLDRAG